MKINLKVKGVDNVLAMLRHTGEVVPDKARKQMHRAAGRIVKNAQLFAPVDEGNLEKSIRIEKTYGDRGRLQIDIVTGGEVNGVNVSDYAKEVHENYSHMNPGPGTIDKRSRNPGVFIGEKFLERAVKPEQKKIREELKGVVYAQIRDIMGKFTSGFKRITSKIGF